MMSIPQLYKNYFFIFIFVYNNYIMGKRLNSVGNMKTSKSHKTAKRLAVKKEMLEEAKKRPNSRHYTGKK